jgi:hypothetical protein
MNRLETLQREFDENAIQLANPIDLADLERLKEHRQIILSPAGMLDVSFATRLEPLLVESKAPTH